jgi:hypothetical protein
VRRPPLASLALLLPVTLGAVLRHPGAPDDEGGALLAPRGAFPNRETGVRALELAADLVAEHYVLLGSEIQGAGGSDPTTRPTSDTAPGVPRVLGVARRTARTEEGEAWVALEVHLFDERTRVHHAERYSATEGPRLVYREVRDRTGRTVMLEWDEELGALRSIEYTGARDAHRRSVAPEGGALLWLWCMEEVRAGGELSGELPLYDPVAGRVDPVRAETTWLPIHGFPFRSVTWRRSDGTLSAEFFALGDRILVWRRQRGGAVLQRVDEAEYDVTLTWGRERGGVPGAVTGSLRGADEGGG